MWVRTVSRPLHIPSGTPEEGVSTRWEGAAVHSCGPAGLHSVDLPLDEYCEQNRKTDMRTYRAAIAAKI